MLLVFIGNYDARSYWEHLIEYEDGYKLAETLWSEIAPLYKKLQDFVVTRLSRRYEKDFPDVPVYILG